MQCSNNHYYQGVTNTSHYSVTWSRDCKKNRNNSNVHAPIAVKIATVRLAIGRLQKA